MGDKEKEPLEGQRGYNGPKFLVELMNKWTVGDISKPREEEEKKKENKR